MPYLKCFVELNVSNTFTNNSDALPNEQQLVTSFNGLMTKFKPLIEIADEVAKVRCSVSAPSLDDLK